MIDRFYPSSRLCWLIWGLGERCWPHEHPKLPLRPSVSPWPERASGHSHRANTSELPAATQAPEPKHNVFQTDHSQIWPLVLKAVQRQVSGNEFVTWIAESDLLDLEGDQAIIGVPTIFAREKVGTCYRDMLCRILSGVMSHPVNVQVVIGRS